MSRHTYHTTHDSRPVTVAAGWDRPLQGFHMTILYLDNDADHDDEYAFNNLDTKDPWPLKFDDFMLTLKDMDIMVPEEMLADIVADGKVNMGNKVLNWDRTLEQCSKCKSRTIERQYYVWRREDIEDDNMAFDISGAETTDMGNDWWCGVCQAHPETEEYRVAITPEGLSIAPADSP